MIPAEFISWFQIPQNFINISTIVILAWTAIETARARRSSNDAHEYNLLPLLTIYFEGEFNKGVKLYMNQSQNPHWRILNRVTMKQAMVRNAM
jgi:hypothetical protein